MQPSIPGSMYSMFSTILYSANFTPCCSTGSWLCITLIGYFVDRLLVYHKFPQFYHLEMQVVYGDLLLSLVRPHLEYGCPVWDSHLIKDNIIYHKMNLEGVQKFSLRFATHLYCDRNYQDLIELFQVLSLEERRLELKFGLLFKIVHNLFHFPTVPELRGGLTGLRNLHPFSSSCPWLIATSER